MPPTTPLSSSSHQVDGRQLQAMLHAGLMLLQRRRPQINALNVYPVPDGDTGDNMAHTLLAAWREVENQNTSHAGETLAAAAHGALRGARGNSGVILSQILRGMAHHAAPHPHLTGTHLAQALTQGFHQAWESVQTPVEGTILTVMRAAAHAAQQVAPHHPSIPHLLQKVVEAATEALAQTPDLLAPLRQAGVVDAGAAGLVTLFQGMLQALRPDLPIAPLPAPSLAHRPVLAPPSGQTWGYDIQCLVHHPRHDETTIHRTLLALGGESIVIGRSDSVTKIHVHGSDPGPILDYIATLGPVEDLVVEDMTRQAQEAGWMEAPGQETPCLPIVAVIAGQGFRQLFQSLGVCQWVEGGATMNPSVAALLRAVENHPDPEVILLPNHPHILLAAQQTARLADKPVHVVPTRDLAQGVAALLAYNPQEPPSTNAHLMQQAVEDIQTVRITPAVRDATFGHTSIRAGQILALSHGQLTGVADSAPEAAWQALLPLLEEEPYETLTFYIGQQGEMAQARALAQRLQTRFPYLEIDILTGHQPHDHYLIALE